MIQKFSNWCFSSAITIESISSKIRDFSRLLDANKPGVYVENFETYELEIEGENLTYLTGRITYQWIKRGYETRPIEEQLDNVSEEFIIYDNSKEKLLIILGSKTSSQKLIKHAFTSEIFGEISEKNVIDKDILYWLVYRLRLFPNSEILADSSLYLRGLVGYMGTSSDSANLVRGQGLRVIALMGTLAFIFNDENLKALKPVIQYKDTKMTVEFSSTNTNRVLIDKADKIEQQLLVSHKILPKILEAYNYAVENDEWNTSIKLSFLQEIGTSIAAKVDEQKVRIKNELKSIQCSDENILNSNYDESEENNFEFESQFALDVLEND